MNTDWLYGVNSRDFLQMVAMLTTDDLQKVLQMAAKSFMERFANGGRIIYGMSRKWWSNHLRNVA
jgi:hypothetical protein